MRRGDAAILLVLAACSRPSEPTSRPDAALVSNGAPLDTSAIARAEDRRLADEVSDGARTNPDVRVRRRAARALARIADERATSGLLRALSDEDRETNAWGAYGLGFGCKGHEEATVRALAARWATLQTTTPKDDAEPNTLDAAGAIARAIGRCGGAVAERVLLDALRARTHGTLRDRERATYALGDLSSRRGSISDEVATALLDVAAYDVDADDDATRVRSAALYPFSRNGHFSEAFASRLLDAARASLSRRPSPERIFAVRALRFAGADAAAELEAIASGSFTPAERGEAARALATMGEPGRDAAGRVLAKITPDRDAIAITGLGGDSFEVLLSVILAVANDPPKSAEPALRALSNLNAPGTPPVPLARRIAILRCSAASALAHGAYDADVITKCDQDGTEARENAELASLLRRPIAGPRRAKWKALAASSHVRVREAALDAISEQKDLGDVATNALADALASKLGGVVATAAKVLFEHPDRASLAGTHDVSPQIMSALTHALDEPWEASLVETRVNLMDAAIALHMARARDFANAACHDANVTVRDRAQKALRALGDAANCTPPDSSMLTIAPEISHEVTRATRVVFATDAGDLSINFEPALAPIAATRMVALAKSGFYANIVVHRVVPGFVVQFGDPGGDGFGGSPTLLRCETSPVPFMPRDVGVPLAGRDTGASQLFVTLSRVPHLDGEYAWIGHAEGDWEALAEGDVIRSARVEE